MSTPFIFFNFGDSITKDARDFVNSVVKVLAETRGIRLEECSIEDSKPAKTIFCLTQESKTSLPGPSSSIATNIDSFITHISDELDANSRPADASTLRYVLDLCHTEKERGGLGFSETPCMEWSLTQRQFEDLRNLFEAWLESLNSVESGRSLPATLSVKASATKPMTLAEKILAHHAFLLPSALGLESGDFVRTSVDWIIASELSWVVSPFILGL